MHGRFITGQDNDDNFTFAPNELTCDLAPLAPSKTIPATGGTATLMAASHPTSPNNGGTLSVPNAPLGNAVLSIVSGLATPPGAVNPLAGRPLILLRFSYGDSLARGGVSVPAGISPCKYAGTACGSHSPDCPRISQAIQASAASAARADATGKATLPGVPPGTYYLMVSALIDKQPLIWGKLPRFMQDRTRSRSTNTTPHL